MRYTDRVALRLSPGANARLIALARKAGHDNVSIVVRQILERALKVKSVPRVRACERKVAV